MEDLSEASLEDVAEFFRTYYTPDNAVLTIAGDFDPAAARAMVGRHFGPIPRGTGRPALPSMAVPPQFGAPRREVVPDAVVTTRILLACRIPAARTADWYTASLLAAVLGNGEGSRLPRALVREQAIASEATAFTFDLHKGSDLLVIDVVARPGVAPEAIEAVVVAEVERLIADGVTAEERGRALALLETAWIAGLQSVGARADKLSQFATYRGDAALVNAEPERHAAVTVEALAAFARTWLVESNRATLLYVPQSTSAAEAA